MAELRTYLADLPAGARVGSFDARGVFCPVVVCHDEHDVDVELRGSRFHFEDAPPKPVYLDRDQCNFFAVPYNAPWSFTVTAATLLKSKSGDGYDATMAAQLRSYGRQSIRLVRTADDDNGPGWFTVAEVVRS